MDYQYSTPSTNPSDNADMQERAKTRRVLGHSLLIGGSVILAIFGMLTVLITYLCVFNQCSRLSGRVLTSTAPLGKVLTISQVASHVVPMTVPIVMGLFTYRLGAQWLHSSDSHSSNRPSPLQLGLLMSICNGANLPALSRALKYVFKVGDSAKKQDLPVPRLLSKSIYLLVSLLALMYMVSAADAWFHASSTAVILQSTAPFRPDSTSTALGRELNSTRCNEALGDSQADIRSTCGITIGLAAHDVGPRSKGLTALANSSTEVRVAFTNDQTAILIAPSIPPNITYTAKTVGLKASCRSITNECLVPSPTGYGGGCCLNLNCKGPTLFNITLPGNDSSGPLDAQGNSVQGYNIPTNPFNIGVVVSSQAYTGPQDTFINNTQVFSFIPLTNVIHDGGWFVHASAGAYNVVYCNVTALDVIYTYTADRFITRSSSPVPAQDARYIISGGYLEGMEIIKTLVEGVGTKAGESYEAAFGLELTRRFLGLGAIIYQPTEATDVSQELTAIGSKFDLIPFALLLLGMTAYGVVVLSIMLQAILWAAGVPYVQLASSYLTNPLTTVHALYGPVEPASTWEPDPFAKFVKEGEGDRLSVGPVLTGPANQSVFAVTRRGEK